MTGTEVEREKASRLERGMARRERRREREGEREGEE